MQTAMYSFIVWAAVAALLAPFAGRLLAAAWRAGDVQVEPKRRAGLLAICWPLAVPSLALYLLGGAMIYAGSFAGSVMLTRLTGWAFDFGGDLEDPGPDPRAAYPEYGPYPFKDFSKNPPGPLSPFSNN